MKQKIQFTIALLVLSAAICRAQLTPKFKQKNITAEKAKGAVIVPIDIKFNNPEKTQISVDLQFVVLSSQVDKYKFNVSKISFISPPSAFFTKTFYLTIDSSANISEPRTMKLSGSIINGEITTSLDSLNVTIVPFVDQIYTLGDYLSDSQLNLQYVTRVESVGSILTLHGYPTKNSVFPTTRKIELQRNQVYKVTEPKFKPSFSLLTVPYKVRAEIKDQNLKNSATGGLANLGINMDLLGKKTDKYFSSGNKSTQKLSLGVWLAPSVEELDSLTTRGMLGKAKGKVEKSKQLFVSAGLTLNYTYNNIQLTLVPIGFDIPTSGLGNRWSYRYKPWWGFGIGVDPKIFATILNK